MDESIVTIELANGPTKLRICHPPGTFALTPASLISLDVIDTHRQLLKGIGLDWGSGTGCLTIAAAMIPDVGRVFGLEVSEANVAIARENAIQNGVFDKTTFFLSDSYTPLSFDDRMELETLRGKVDFILANPPSSEGDDGFEYRRIVLRGACNYLTGSGKVFLSISYQYGHARIQNLCKEVPGFSYGRILGTTGWVPFDLDRPDLLHCLHLYAEEELRGGLEYAFQHPDRSHEECMNAREALAYYT